MSLHGKLPRLSLSAQVIIGLLLGIAGGLFFGERIAVVQPLGAIFIGLLQMTVIPYIVVSLIAALGRLTMEQIRMLAVRGGGLILAFWAVILVVVALIPLGYPNWESASFYSTSLIAESSPTDFLDLYIPSNPFQSLAEGVIPAIVLFSIAMGLATAMLPDKLIVVHFLDQLTHALMLIAQFVARLAPIGVSREQSSGVVDVITPINFNIPNLGKLIALSFVLFAGWFAGNEVALAQYPQFLISGLFSFFGEVVIALPFLLDLMKIPADMFNLFMSVDVFTGRFGTLLAGVHTVALSLLVTAAVAGVLKVRWHRLGLFLGGSVALLIGTLLAINLFFTHLVENRYTKDQAVQAMTLTRAPGPDTRVFDDLGAAAPPPPASNEAEASALDRIRERGRLRACYVPGLLPHSYENVNGELVGYDIDLMHRLAADLEVSLDLIAIDRARFIERLDSGWCDLIATGLTITAERAREASFSEPYLVDGLSLVVPDSRRKLFRNIEQLRTTAGAGLRIAVLSGLSLYEKRIERAVPAAEIVRLDTIDEFFTTDHDADALFTLAMIGSTYTLLHPSYSVVVPKPVVKVPVALALPRNDPVMKAFIDNWLMLQEQGGQLRELYDHWVLGQGVTKGRERWSVIRDVLGWVD